MGSDLIRAAQCAKPIVEREAQVLSPRMNQLVLNTLGCRVRWVGVERLEVK